MSDVVGWWAPLPGLRTGPVEVCSNSTHSPSFSSWLPAAAIPLPTRSLSSGLAQPETLALALTRKISNRTGPNKAHSRPLRAV